MKVLIIGKNSYIGEHISKYLTSFEHEVFEFDIEHEELKDEIFKDVDSVIHVAAIVHRKDITDYSIYQRINVDLPYKVGQLAKRNGVKQFVFLSSMAVYEQGKSLRGNWLDEDSKCEPQSLYGKSKYEAELLLNTLADEAFKICHMRPANVYGKDCRGSYMNSFKKIVQKLPCIPVAYEQVKQGMLYIENLTELVRLIIENQAEGIFPAQDKMAVSSVELMTEIANAIKIKKRKSKFFGFPFRIFRIALVKKLYGGVAYTTEYATTQLGDYCLYSFTQGIQKTFSE